MIIVDIWGGKNSQDHVARFFCSPEDAVTIALKELEGGYLVNLRKEAGFGIQQNWDRR